MKFTKNTIMLDIAKRLGDNEIKLYKYRSWSAFLNNLTLNSANRDAWERQEISPLLKTDAINLVFSDAVFQYSLPADAIAFTDVWIDPIVANSWFGILKRIDEVDAQRASTGEIAFMPAGNEIFWYNIGDKFRFILSKDMYSIRPNAKIWEGAVVLEYVADPKTLNFDAKVSGTSPYTGFEVPSVNGGILPDLVDWFGFSSRFLYRCINDAIASIRFDDEVAKPEESAIDIETGQGAV